MIVRACGVPNIAAEALFTGRPGSWRHCYRLEPGPRPLDQVIVDTLPAHVTGHICVLGHTVGIFRMMLRFRSLKVQQALSRSRDAGLCAHVWAQNKESRMPVVVMHTEPPEEGERVSRAAAQWWLTRSR